MIRVTIEAREGALTRRVRISARSSERAIKMAGDGKRGRRARLPFPIDPEAFFVPGDPSRREAACRWGPARGAPMRLPLPRGVRGALFRQATKRHTGEGPATSKGGRYDGSIRRGV